MKDIRSTTEKIEFSAQAASVFKATAARAFWRAERENSFTNHDYDGKTPFLDTFEQNADQPYIICLARAITASWLQSAPKIYDNDIIVGVTRPMRPIYEHFSFGIQTNWDVLNAHECYSSQADSIKARFEKLRSRMVPLDFGDRMNPEFKKYFGKESVDGFIWVGGYQGHTVPSYPLLLSLGLDAEREKIREYRKKYQDDEEKQIFYDALLIVADGITAFAEMYADAAEQKAALTDDPAAKGNLLRIAANCRSAAHKAPETLGEAVQLMWFYCLWDWCDCIGRADQYLYPFYAKCVEEEGRAVAENYICGLWFKIFENGIHNITVGGVKPDGSDATNELTYLLLQIGRKCHQTHPRISVRFHKNSPPELMPLVVQMWSEGMSDPSVTSDEVAVNGLCEYGVPIEDARDYSMLGCQEIEIPGKSNFGCEDGLINLAKIFELTINNGYDHQGNKLGLPTGRITDYESVEDLWEAYKKQLSHIVPIWAELTNYGVDIRVANKAKLVKSLFTEACVERGLDLDNGGSIYNYGVVETAGSSAVADSFAAIQKLVFEEGRISRETLDKAIEANFEGYEKERQLLLHAPKFGNDEELPDFWAHRVLDFFWSEIGKYRSRRGGVFTGACSLLSGGIYHGEHTWALPDGRFKGMPLSNTIGPREGNDRRGVTAMLSSVAKLPLKKGVGGTTLNVLLPKSLMQTAELKKDVGDMMFAYLMKGGQMAQITTADLEELKDAQINPDLHRDLIVRVGGFSIEFVQLDPGNQNEIISRYGEQLG